MVEGFWRRTGYARRRRPAAEADAAASTVCSKIGINLPDRRGSTLWTPVRH